MTEDMYQCDVSIYNLSSKTPLYTSSSHVVSICAATAFDTRMPRYVAYTAGSMSCVLVGNSLVGNSNTIKQCYM